MGNKDVKMDEARHSSIMEHFVRESFLFSRFIRELKGCNLDVVVITVFNSLVTLTHMSRRPAFWFFFSITMAAVQPSDHNLPILILQFAEEVLIPISAPQKRSIIILIPTFRPCCRPFRKIPETNLNRSAVKEKFT